MMCRNTRHPHHETRSSCSFPLRRRLLEASSSLSFLMATCSARALRQPTHLLGSSSWSPASATSPLRFGSFVPVLRRLEITLDRRDCAKGPQGGGVLFGVWMKANNRKSKKKTGRSGDSGKAAGSSATPAPLRVTKDAPISVRAQIKYAKIKKSMRKAHPSAAKKATNSYRRVKSLDYEDIVEPEDLSKVYMPDIAPALMVDGYNIIYRWEKCCLLAESGNLEEARRVLLDELDTLSAMRGWTITVVFDAHMRKGGSRRNYMTPNKIEVVFTEDGESADMYVERQTMELKDSGCPNVMVATGDKLMQSLVLGAGAEVFSPDRIIEEIEISRHEVRAYTDMYLRRKEKLIEATQMQDLANSVHYVEVGARAASRARSRRNGGGQGGSGGRTFNIEDDL